MLPSQFLYYVLLFSLFFYANKGVQEGCKDDKMTEVPLFKKNIFFWELQELSVICKICEISFSHGFSPSTTEMHTIITFLQKKIWKNTSGIEIHIVAGKAAFSGAQ